VSAPDDDPIRANRSRIAKWSLLANRIGWLLYALAMSSFVMAFVLGFSGPLVTVVVVSLIAGSVLLAPSIVIGYAVKAADRADRDGTW
jgi:hypothetical protein